MEIVEGVIRLGRITPSTISIILHKILNLIHLLLNNNREGELISEGAKKRFETSYSGAD